MRPFRVAPLAIILPLTAACIPNGGVEPTTEAAPAEIVQPVRTAPSLAPSTIPTLAPSAPARPAVFTFDGELEQGGWIRGQVPGATVSARLGNMPLTLDDDGRFFAGFDRDAAPTTNLAATLADGRTITSPLTIAPRDWNIERVNVARRAGGASEAFLRRRRPELEAIGAARANDTGSEGWRQSFVWPATGRISGRFGSQRIYRGEPGSYHSGLDIAGGQGTTYVAPADGVVTLAADDFSLEGRLLIIDHGQGLNSAFLHSSELFVREGQAVKQGQPLGRIGATGRATGPHLHWSIKWGDARLDPLLFLPPMP